MAGLSASTRFPFYRKNMPAAVAVGAKPSVDLSTRAGLARRFDSL